MAAITLSDWAGGEQEISEKETFVNNETFHLSL